MQTPKRYGWKDLFRTIKRLKLSWVWIILGLALNLLLSDLMVKLPDTTADLLSGQLTGTAVMEAVMFYVVLGVLSFAMVLGQVQAQTFSVFRARKSLWKKMLGMRMDYFDRNDPSDLMSTITNDADAALTDFVNMIVYLIPTVYYIVKALLRINEYHWILALSCFALIPLKFIYAWIMGRHFQVSSARVYQKIGGLTGFLADRINHLPLIKTYTNEQAESAAGESAAKKLLKAHMKIIHLDNISSGIVSVMDILQKFIVVVVAVVLLQQGKITVAIWLAFFLFSQNLFSYMDQIVDMWVRAKSVMGTFHRVIEIMDGEDEENGATKPFPEQGDVHFQNVTFTYPETDEPALKDVSFTVPRGGSVAIVGLCGSGKTTSVSLLERFYDPAEGKITIGETDIQEISLADYRRHFAYVQQNTDVFGGTLREALTYGIDRELTDEEILSAAEKTGFSEYLALCEEGLDTEVASGGDSMSGGQNQRLVLTRELLRGGDIILLDEPTSALDVRISVKIQEMIDTLFANQTKILVTHDLSFAKRYDKILVMEGGRLAGEGTHETLLKTCEAYRRIIESAEEEGTV